MTTDTVVLERALVVMATAMSIQTLLLIGVAVIGFIAWRKANRAIEETRTALAAQMEALRAHVDHMSGAVDEVAGSFKRSSAAVGEVVDDVREAMGTVRHSVGTVASVMTAPRTAIALGVWRGVQMWRRRRGSKRVTGTVTSQL